LKSPEGTPTDPKDLVGVARGCADRFTRWLDGLAGDVETIAWNLEVVSAYVEVPAENVETLRRDHRKIGRSEGVWVGAYFPTF